ncbi:MFS transporter [Priestia taiwanensis]|uniref:Chloramphenicol resistance protein n=1 Tax=Priestia taiwanensis TaxID=1347902 RepID=A0A917EPE3_9BACI|nr:MFS transporter [Priestia taiwanensis]MBM7363166.1 DHA1 family purine base/nucleoside efflux pump-like MFS transporter [Priestia taiwanensis]GGE68237.1 chloramphenicol resistance protein [Priestia taiwanensis]
MNFKVYILAISAFIVGTVELIIGGILDTIADDLGVSVSSAGQLITVFSVVFAIAAPILLATTARMERKQLYMYSLFVFLLGNILAALSTSYMMLMAARVVSAASGSLLVVLSITIASSIVAPAYRARAIGIIFMGISGSLVLGVPIGLVLTNAFNWKALFFLVAGLTVLAMIGIHFFIEKIEAKANQIPLRQQLATLKDSKIISAHLISILMLTGHLTLYAYLTPFLKDVVNLDATWVTIAYFIFGIAAVAGGGFGGWMADTLGSKKSILFIVTAFVFVIFSLPVMSSFALPIFFAVMILWSSLSWAISPAQQNYLIQSAPESAEIQQGLNASCMHLGIAFGSSIGALVIEQSSVYYNAWVGGLFVIAALGCAIFSFTRNSTSSETVTN